MQQEGIPVLKGIKIANQIAIEHGLDIKQGKMFDLITRSIPVSMVDGTPIIGLKDLQGFLSNMIDAVDNDSSVYLGVQRGLRVPYVAPIDEFVQSPMYMNQGSSIWEKTMSELRRLYHPSSNFVEVVLTGAIGIGKNYFSEMVMAYELYKLSCFYNPQVEFGLAAGSSIVFILQSKTSTLARKVMFNQFMEKIRLSPYFQEHFMFDEGVKSELRFPNNIYVLPIGGSDTGALGMNVFGGCFPAGHEYLLSNGELAKIEDINKVQGKCLTYSGKKIKTSTNDVQAVATGHKRLVRLHFSNGSCLVCTPDQRIKNIYGGWVRADESYDRHFTSFSTQDLWLAGRLSDNAYYKCLLNQRGNLPDYCTDLRPREIMCTKIDNLGIVVPVYDVQLVEDTHTFFSLDETKSSFLLTKNCIDEMNFMARVQNSVLTTNTDEDVYDQAERLYRVIIRRIKSRFMQKGRVPGKLLLVSSVNYPGDFTDRKIEEAAKEIREGKTPTIFVMKHSQWEALPADKFSGKRFLIEVGNEMKQSRIIDDKADAIDDDDVIEVPVEYRTEFERDIEKALRDLAGIATGTKSPFIPQRELIVKAQQVHATTYGDKSLFTVQSCALSRMLDPNSPDWELLVNQEYLEDAVLDPSHVFSAHIDVGLTNDAAGLAVGHISGYKLLPSIKVYNERTSAFVEVKDVRAPIYTIDGVLQIVSPPNGEVDLEMIRDLIFYLRSIFFLKWVTMDSYQSAMLIQAFKKVGIKSGILSVDTNTAPYTEVKQALKDERLLFPPHAVTAKELRELERDPEKNKIDHPSSGSKDCSDAIAGTIFVLQRKEVKYGRRSTRRSGKKLSNRSIESQQSSNRRVRHIHIGSLRRRDR